MVALIAAPPGSASIPEMWTHLVKIGPKGGYFCIESTYNEHHTPLLVMFDTLKSLSLVMSCNVIPASFKLSIRVFYHDRVGCVGVGGGVRRPCNVGQMTCIVPAT